MRSRTQHVALGVMLLALLMLAACSSPGPTKGDLTVYVAAPLSGWQADGGQTVVGGARLAAERINKQGGLLGYRVNIVPVNDEADSEVAVQVANSISQAVQGGERILGVIGHYNSGQSAEALEVYKDLPLIVITPTSSDPSLTQRGYRNFFRVNATDAAQGPHDAAFLVNTLGAERIAIVFAENDYGRGLRDEIVPALEALGRPPIAVIGIPEAADTQADAVAQLQEADPDAVFLAGYETEGYILLPEMREAGIEAEFMASDGCFLYEFIDGSGRWSEGVYVSGLSPDPNVVTDEAWWEDYQLLEGRNPGTYSIAGYSAMLVLAEGVRRADSLDADAVQAALHEVELETPVGTIRYDANGDLAEQRIFVFQVENGQFVQRQPAP